MYCETCGKDLAADENICGDCGTDQSLVVKTPEESSTPARTTSGGLKSKSKKAKSEEIAFSDDTVFSDDMVFSDETELPEEENTTAESPDDILDQVFSDDMVFSDETEVAEAKEEEASEEVGDDSDIEAILAQAAAEPVPEETALSTEADTAQQPENQPPNAYDEIVRSDPPTTVEETVEEKGLQSASSEAVDNPEESSEFEFDVDLEFDDIEGDDPQVEEDAYANLSLDDVTLSDQEEVTIKNTRFFDPDENAPAVAEVYVEPTGLDELNKTFVEPTAEADGFTLDPSASKKAEVAETPISDTDSSDTDNGTLTSSVESAGSEIVESAGSEIVESAGSEIVESAGRETAESVGKDIAEAVPTSGGLDVAEGGVDVGIGNDSESVSAFNENGSNEPSDVSGGLNDEPINSEASADSEPVSDVELPGGITENSSVASPVDSDPVRDVEPSDDKEEAKADVGALKEAPDMSFQGDFDSFGGEDQTSDSTDPFKEAEPEPAAESAPPPPAPEEKKPAAVNDGKETTFVPIHEFSATTEYSHQQIIEKIEGGRYDAKIHAGQIFVSATKMSDYELNDYHAVEDFSESQKLSEDEVSEKIQSGEFEGRIHKAKMYVRPASELAPEKSDEASATDKPTNLSGGDKKGVGASQPSPLVISKTLDGYGSLARGVQGDYDFHIGDIIVESWHRTKGSKRFFNGALAICVLFFVIFSVGTFFLFQAIGVDPFNLPTNKAIAVFALQAMVGSLFALPLVMGTFIIGLKRSLWAPIQLGDILSVTGRSGPLMATLLLMYLLIGVGFALLILPGIYLLFAYSLALPLAAEKGVAPWEALESSRKAVTNHWSGIFGLLFVLWGINVIAVIPLGLGLLWSVPMTVIATGMLYRNIFGCEEETILE